MPERIDGPKTDDLDDVFHGLVDDVEAHSRWPGPDRAVRTAGARRLVVAASALALVLVVAVGLGGWVLQGSRGLGVPAVAGPSPAGPSPAVATPSAPPAYDPDVPAPGLMTLERLNAASRGWATWREGTAGAADAPRCLTQTTAPVRTTSEHYHSKAGVDASLERLRFASRDDSNKAMLATVQAFISCPEDTGLHNDDISADLEVVAVPWSMGGRRGTVWLVNFGDRMDVFQFVGTEQPSVEAFDRVSRLLAADVQVP